MMMNGKDVEQVIYLLSKEKKSCSAECESTSFLKITLMAKEEQKFTKLIRWWVVKGAMMPGPK